MSDQEMNAVPQQAQPQEGAAASQAQLPGAMLAAQRQKKGWSVEQVASLVKLAPRQIQAIEADNYAALPGLAVARGFVRSYAKVLGLDVNALTAAMPQESAVAQRDHIVPQHSLSTPFSEGPLPAMMMSTRGNTPVLPIVAAVVVAALLAGGAAVRWTELGADVPQLAWLKAHKSDAAPAAEGAGSAPDVAANGEAASNETPVNARVESINPPASAEPTKPAASTAPVAEATPAASVPAVAAAAPATPAVTPAAPAAKPAPSESAAATASTGSAASAPTQMAATTVPSGLNIVNSKDMLRLTFREDSWVEIRRADKTTIISRLLKAGTTEAFDVSDASMLIIGNAAGVDATLRGQPLDLKTPGGSNVARLNLN